MHLEVYVTSTKFPINFLLDIEWMARNFKQEKTMGSYVYILLLEADVGGHTTALFIVLPLKSEYCSDHWLVLLLLDGEVIFQCEIKCSELHHAGGKKM